jgi:hypothetical protein
MKIPAMAVLLVSAAALSSVPLAVAAPKTVTVQITGHVLSGTNGGGLPTGGPGGVAGPFGTDGEQLTPKMSFDLTLTFPFDPTNFIFCPDGVHKYSSVTQTPGTAALTINGGTFTFELGGKYDASSIQFNAQLWAPVPKCYNSSMTALQVKATYASTGSRYTGNSYLIGPVEPKMPNAPLTSDVEWDPPAQSPSPLKPVPTIGFSIAVNGPTTEGRGQHAYGTLTPETFMVMSH